MNKIKNIEKILVVISVLLMLSILTVVNVDIVSAYSGMGQQTVNSTNNNTTSNATKSINNTANSTNNVANATYNTRNVTADSRPIETPVPCSEYVAAHPEIYPISSCQQIVSSWSNSITNDGSTRITVNVGTTVKFSIVTNSDAKLSSVTAEPNNVDKYLYNGYRTSFGDVRFDKVGHYNVNLGASNSFARGGVTWSVDVIDTIYTPPAPGQIYSYDNIRVDHNIVLCNVASDDERAITGGSLEKNCGNPDLNIDHYPLDLYPSGGNSGKVSASEMVLVNVITSGSMSLVPWRTQPVNMSWYDGSDNRLMFNLVSHANNINNKAYSFIGHFSHEINKPGKYYVDVDVVGFGSSRVVFNVTGNGQVITIPIPVVTYTQNLTVKNTSIPIVTVNPPALGSENSNSNSNSGGCWDSYVGFGTCAGGSIAETGIGILLGVADTIANIFGL